MIQNYNGEQNARKKCIKITEKLSGFDWNHQISTNVVNDNSADLVKK